jgi:ABC-type transport system involved in multi-copper enzyme maturation permease subunit
MPHPWRSLWYRILGLTLVLGLALGLAVAYFPTYAENIGGIKKLAPLPVLRSLLDELEAGGLWAYMSGQHLFKGCNTIGCVAAVVFGAFAIAGESERRTLEIVLARPRSRRSLLLERYLTGLLALVLPTFATTYAIEPLMALCEVPGGFPTWLLSLAALHQSLFLAAVFSLAFLCSALAQRPGRIAGVLLALGMVQFSLYLVETATRFSVFRLADVWSYRRIEQQGALDAPVVLGLAAFCLICLAAAERAFARRLPA